MLPILPTVAVAVVACLIAAVLGYRLRKLRHERSIESTQAGVSRLVAQAESQAKAVLLAARDDALSIRDEAERETDRRRKELDQREQRLMERHDKLDRRFDHAESRERAAQERERLVLEREAELHTMQQDWAVKLEGLAGLSRDQARAELIAAVEQQARADLAHSVRQIEARAREEADRRAREVIVTAIQRCASDTVTEHAASIVVLPSDEMKGRIIGRQGRNIRTFQNVTGVDVVIDDTPETVVLSCYDPVRREVGRLALTRLVSEGRIHPARIEQVVHSTEREFEAIMMEHGERAAYAANVPGLHPQIVRTLGRLHFRTSYGQNVLAHSVETAHLGAALAAEVGAEVQTVRAGGLLHDIGKALSHDLDGPHALVGAGFCRRHGVRAKVVNAIAAHHHEVEQESLEAVLVEAADAISGARPGARLETIDQYVKRLKVLEDVAKSFAGVDECYAIQAGREVRVFVRPEEVDDLGAIELSRDIARRVEESLEYPGQIRVTVIRETRSTEIAK
jgi:ribonuclease Y